MDFEKPGSIRVETTGYQGAQKTQCLATADVDDSDSEEAKAAAHIYTDVKQKFQADVNVKADGGFELAAPTGEDEEVEQIYDMMFDQLEDFRSSGAGKSAKRTRGKPDAGSGSSDEETGQASSSTSKPKGKTPRKARSENVNPEQPRESLATPAMPMFGLQTTLGIAVAKSSTHSPQLVAKLLNAADTVLLTVTQLQTAISDDATLNTVKLKDVIDCHQKVVDTSIL